MTSPTLFKVKNSHAQKCIADFFQHEKWRYEKALYTLDFFLETNGSMQFSLAGFKQNAHITAMIWKITSLTCLIYSCKTTRFTRDRDYNNPENIDN